MPVLSIFCDGSSHSRGGLPGGWAFIVVQDDVVYISRTLAQWQTVGFDGHSFNQNPAFTNEAGGNLALLLGSAGRDTGVDALVPIDVRKSPRPVGAGFDMGAYEN